MERWANRLVLSQWRPSLCRAKNRLKGISRKEHFPVISEGSSCFNVHWEDCFQTPSAQGQYILSYECIRGVAVSTVGWSYRPWARRKPKPSLCQGCCALFFRKPWAGGRTVISRRGWLNTDGPGLLPPCQDIKGNIHLERQTCSQTPQTFSACTFWKQAVTARWFVTSPEVWVRQSWVCATDRGGK